MPSGDGSRFGPFRLDPRGRRLFRDDEPVALQPLLVDLLIALVSRPGELLRKEELISIGWPHHAVADNNLAQAISRLRAALDGEEPERYVQTVPRRGYRFVAPVAHDGAGPTDDELNDMMTPHVALLDGRAMLETLESDRIDRAIALFTQCLARADAHALHHVGLANAHVLHFESTRATSQPDLEALRHAVRHAGEARRLAPGLGEAWATYGFVIERTGDRRAAIAALLQATTIEPEHWAHHLRLAWCSWGERRRQAARRTLELRRGLAAAHWLLATVYVARNDLATAERELDAAFSAMTHESGSGLSGAALHWLKGLICLARGADDEALVHFDRELALEPRRHLYGRECCASAWYAKGAIHVRRGELDAASAALAETLRRVPGHAMARVAMTMVGGDDAGVSAHAPDGGSVAPSVDAAMACALRAVFSGDTASAVPLLASSLAAAEPGNAGWLLPVEPMLNVQANAAAWAQALTVLHERTFG